MRRVLLVCFALAGLALAPQAFAATTVGVSIKSTGFSPTVVSITAEDTVRWKNNDTHSHQIVSTRGTFASPVLAPGKSYSFTFLQAGTYYYRDALHPNLTGTIKVAGLPPALVLGVDLPQIGYGSSVTLIGQVNSKAAGELVTLTAKPFGQVSPIVIATVVTVENGAFAYRTKPQLLTVYQAMWKSANSLPATVAVAPVVTFGRSNGWVTRVFAGRSMAAKTVQVQSLSADGRWVTIKRLQLDGRSAARFRLALEKGSHRLRIAMSVNQAGVGYLAGFSKEVRWVQR
jgi:plastocyanin